MKTSQKGDKFIKKIKNMQEEDTFQKSMRESQKIIEECF
jgi:hypothetical protein